MLFEPVGEALVQLGAGRLRQRVVGGVADQQVAEAERVVARELRRVGPDELLADERQPAAAAPAARLGRAPATAPRWKTWPSTAPRSSTRARPGRAGRAAPPAAPGSSAARRPRRRPTRARAPASPRRRAGCPRPPRGSARAARDDAAELVEQLARSRRRRAARAGPSSRSACRRPSRAAVEQLRAAPCRAAGSARRGERSATCSTRSRNVSSPQWRSSKTQTSGRSCACSSSSLRKAQAISSADVAASLSPSSERIARGCAPRRTAARRAA